MLWLGITIVCVLVVFGGLKVKRRRLAQHRRLEREAIEATLDAMDDTIDQAPGLADPRRNATLAEDLDRPSTPIETRETKPPALSADMVTPSPSIAPSPGSTANEYQYLEDLLQEQRYEEADRVTWKIMLQLAGAEGRGYLELDELMLLPRSELIHLDQLWQSYSQGRWGFSVQRRLFEQADSDYSSLGKITGWMLDGTWLQKQNTIYDLEQSPPGHLPQAIWRNMFSVFDAFGLSLGVEILLAHDAFDGPAAPETQDHQDVATPPKD
ncbi:MAG: hypothetical protein EAZ61_06980 [Oscillatoriales cyanobacterium]|nr:MAG: hypothetical protein EAZ61_06980 [Oscillatoriales cyanobacterium]